MTLIIMEIYTNRKNEFMEDLTDSYYNEINYIEKRFALEYESVIVLQKYFRMLIATKNYREKR